MRAGVAFVGAGPGDPELLTLKARAALAECQALVYDDAIPAEILALAPAGAERAPATSKTAKALVELARRGLRVVRLAHGDPMLFSAAPQEAAALFDAGVEFEFIPGVPVEVAAANAAGAPLTLGRHATVIFSRTPKAQGSLVHTADAKDGDQAGRTISTTVLRAGVAGQEIHSGDLPEMLAMAQPGSVVITGAPQHLRKKLDWRSRLPLNGRRVVVTRAREQAGGLSARLRELGAEAIELPAIEIHPAADYAPLDRAIAQIASYDWLIFTSANGVRSFATRLDASAVDLRQLRARICAIGPATRAAVEELHLKVDVMGREYVAEALLEALEPFGLQGARVLLPRARVARDVVPAGLAKRGAQVDVVEAYYTAPPDGAAARMQAVFTGVKPEFITFTSSSTVKNFVAAAGLQLLEGVRAVSIGPVTTATAREAGIEVAAEAREFTIPGVVEAILRLCENGETPTD